MFSDSRWRQGGLIFVLGFLFACSGSDPATIGSKLLIIDIQNSESEFDNIEDTLQPSTLKDVSEPGDTSADTEQFTSVLDIESTSEIQENDGIAAPDSTKDTGENDIWTDTNTDKVSTDSGGEDSADPLPNPCSDEGVPPQGTCENNILQQCVETKVVTTDCSLTDSLCVMPQNGSEASCVPTTECIPKCANKVCGDDGCGDSCGPPCAEGSVCTQGQCVEADPNECPNLPPGGDCTGTYLVVCVEGEAILKDCHKEGKICGDNDNGTEKACIYPPDCEPKCTPNACGPDGCGGNCGPCTSGFSCENDICVEDVADPCASIPPEGICEGAVLTHCANNTPTTVDCALQNKICAQKPGNAAYGCVEPPCTPKCNNKECGPDSCGGWCGTSGIKGSGECLGNILVFCENGQIKENDCALEEKVCGAEDPESTNFQCLSSCGSVTAAGQCNGNVLSYCFQENGVEEIVYDDCSTKNKICSNSSSQGAEPWFKCRGCQKVGEGGVCQNNDLWYCENGDVKHEPCGNQLCALISPPGWPKAYGCTDPYPGGSDICDTLPNAGSCENNFIIQCDDGVLKKTDCEAENKKCWILSWPSPHPECVSIYTPPCLSNYCSGDLLVVCNGSSMILKDCEKEGKKCGFNTNELSFICEE